MEAELSGPLFLHPHRPVTHVPGRLGMFEVFGTHQNSIRCCWLIHPFIYQLTWMSRGAKAHHVTGAMLSNCQSTDSPTGAETHWHMNVGQDESLSDVQTDVVQFHFMPLTLQRGFKPSTSAAAGVFTWTAVDQHRRCFGFQTFIMSADVIKLDNSAHCLFVHLRFSFFVTRWEKSGRQQQRDVNLPWRKANPRMACQSVAAVMDEQALLGLNPNADARYRQRVRHGLDRDLCSVQHINLHLVWCHFLLCEKQTDSMFLLKDRKKFM